MNTLDFEIPKSSRLYFGKSATLKRKIENTASEIFAQNGYEEIVTPNFSYLEHQSVDDVKNLIRISDEQNRFLTLRGDSTLDVVRLITNRLGRSTNHKKWFYIQPVFSYPSNETYQIGIEDIGNEELNTKAKLLIQIYKKLGINPIIQFSDVQILQSVQNELNITLEEFKKLQVDELLNSKQTWIRELISIHTRDDLVKKSNAFPKYISDLLNELLEATNKIEYDNLIISPLYYANMKYYKSLIFRSFIGNSIIANGGIYHDNGLSSSGFAIYTDNLIEGLM